MVVAKRTGLAPGAIANERLAGSPESVGILGDHPEPIQGSHGRLGRPEALRRVELRSEQFPVVAVRSARQERSERDMDPRVPERSLRIVQLRRGNPAQFLHAFKTGLRFAGGLRFRVQDQVSEVFHAVSVQPHQVADGLDARRGQMAFALQDPPQQGGVHAQFAGRDRNGKGGSPKFF